MADVVIENLSVQYGATVAVKKLDLHIKSGELVTLLGPSGCGKTTALRCIAGLEPRSGGTIRIGNRLVAGPDGEIPPEHRKLNMVFQNYAIWPHMTVLENVSFGLKLMKLPKADVRRRAEQALDLVGLGAYSTRYGNELSGGQQQRVAVARAVVTEPDVLLFDEPLSNLDASLREQMRVELRELHDRIGKTAIYVTHDQAEAMVMSDRVVLMNDGRIVQEGSPSEVFERPCTRFAAQFLGVANIWSATIGGATSSEECDTVLDGDALRLRVRGANCAAGARGFVGVRAERVEISSLDVTQHGANAWNGRVQRRNYLGTSVRYEIDIGGRVIRVDAHPRAGFAVGDQVCVKIDPAAAVWIPHTPDDGPPTTA